MIEYKVFGSDGKATGFQIGKRPTKRMLWKLLYAASRMQEFVEGSMTSQQFGNLITGA